MLLMFKFNDKYYQKLVACRPCGTGISNIVLKLQKWSHDFQLKKGDKNSNDDEKEMAVELQLRNASSASRLGKVWLSIKVMVVCVRSTMRELYILCKRRGVECLLCVLSIKKQSVNRMCTVILLSMMFFVVLWAYKYLTDLYGGWFGDFYALCTTTYSRDIFHCPKQNVSTCVPSIRPGV